MTNNLFVKIAKRMVYEYTKNHDDYLLIEYPEDFTEDNVFVVWICKTLQNHKALLSTDLPDGRYYEITYNGDKDEFYFDAYKKELNQRVTKEEYDRWC